MKFCVAWIMFFYSCVLGAATVDKVRGKELYERYCMICHEDGIASAPRFHNEQDWAFRLKGKTMNDLLASATKGLNAMPAKGTCMECNEEDLRSAIDYMWSQE